MRTRSICLLRMQSNRVYRDHIVLLGGLPCPSRHIGGLSGGRAAAKTIMLPDLADLFAIIKSPM